MYIICCWSFQWLKYKLVEYLNITKYDRIKERMEENDEI